LTDEIDLDRSCASPAWVIEVSGIEFQTRLYLLDSLSGLRSLLERLRAFHETAEQTMQIGFCSELEKITREWLNDRFENRAQCSTESLRVRPGKIHCGFL
jgi:hypothetical protein